jgi:nicotinate dehydrogenase subunit B
MNSISRRDFIKTSGVGVLMVSFSMTGLASQNPNYGLRAPKIVAKDQLDSWLTIDRNNKITVFVGKVDLGTGTKTALSQIAAEELYVPFERIEMIMGDTATTPDQWITGAAITISQGGNELRQAAANARQALLLRAAEKLQVPMAELRIQDGVISTINKPQQKLSYGSLIGDGFNLKVDPKSPQKKYTDYTLIGKSIQRVDIPD